LARLKPNVLKVLQADGIVERIGADHIHGNVNRAIEAQLAGHGRARKANQLSTARASTREKVRGDQVR
jgi:hypothetical protein